MTVSFCIKCFNQRELVCLAVEGALHQQQVPDEIVISDDASTDGSADAIAEWLLGNGLVEKANGTGERVFEKGSQRVRIILNQKNLGNVGNWQKLCEVATGDVLIKADGDDISLPNRVERVLANWDEKTHCLVHAAETMDLDGKPIGTFEKADGCYGAASAYDRKCYSEFGPIEFPLAADDEVYLWRARLLGGFKQIHERLIRYRVGSGFSSIKNDFRKRMFKNYERTLESRKQTKRDFERYKSKLMEAERHRFAAEIEKAYVEDESMYILWSDAPLKERRAAYKRFNHGRLLSKGGLMHRLQLLPRPISDVITNGLASLR